MDHTVIRQSHIIDDLETKRAHAHGMLVRNRQLLADALDAIRNGDAHVAEEFVDRFLTLVDHEIEYQSDTSRRRS
jgi:hypothetical protein